MQVPESEMRKAADSTDIVRASRAEFDTEFHGNLGHLLSFSPSFLYMTVISDELDLDGFQILCRADVSSLDLDYPDVAFYRKALAVNNAHKPDSYPHIDLSDIQSVLRSVQEESPLVSIERERRYPDECEIGRLKLASGNTYSLRWLSPAAEWEEDSRTRKFSEITRVSFGGRYELTLARVAGLAS